jgi:hypothetical protein
MAVSSRLWVPRTLQPTPESNEAISDIPRVPSSFAVFIQSNLPNSGSTNQLEWAIFLIQISYEGGSLYWE